MSGRADAFLKAKRALRANPGLTDEQVAEATCVHRLLLADVIVQARRELANDSEPGHDWRPQSRHEESAGL